MSEIKKLLYLEGQSLVRSFCALNKIPCPRLKGDPPDAVNSYQATGLYSPSPIGKGTIYVSICESATVGKAGAAWSYPGYVIDRTPYGVHAHELGHHVDSLYAPFPYRPTLGWQGGLSGRVCEAVDEERLTNYCPNVAEWFAEMFRLFVTNPDLLRLLRPQTYRQIRQRFECCEQRRWREVLEFAPDRTIAQCEKKIASVKGK